MDFTGYEAGDTVWLSSKEILPSDTKLDRFGESNTAVETIHLKSESLLFFKSSSVLSYIKDEELQCDENIFLADQNHSDLVSSKYEGIWYCFIIMNIERREFVNPFIATKMLYTLSRSKNMIIWKILLLGVQCPFSVEVM